MKIHLIFVWFTLAGSALMSGTFFAFSNFILPALARRPAPEGMAAMQMINKTVINPVFMIAFMGTALISVYLVIHSILHWQDKRMIYQLLGAVIYIVGCFLVTMFLNVPLNNRLELLDPMTPDGQAFWSIYLADWTRWNTVRAIACLSTLITLVVSLLQQNQ